MLKLTKEIITNMKGSIGGWLKPFSGILRVWITRFLIPAIKFSGFYTVETDRLYEGLIWGWLKKISDIIRVWLMGFRAWMMNFLVPRISNSGVLLLREHKEYDDLLRSTGVFILVFTSEELDNFSGIIKNALESLENDKDSEKARAIITRLNTIHAKFCVIVWMVMGRDFAEIEENNDNIRHFNESETRELEEFRNVIMELKDLTSGERNSEDGNLLDRIISELRNILKPEKDIYYEGIDFGGVKKVTIDYLWLSKEDEWLEKTENVIVYLDKLMQEGV
jgi:hypothetical protein